MTSKAHRRSRQSAGQKSKRLGAALEKSFKNLARRKHKNSSSVVRLHASQDVNHGTVVGRNVPE
ncbi:hypothetical protein AHAS_Ahas18G0178400 [Arachis hypogaea]